MSPTSRQLPGAKTRGVKNWKAHLLPIHHTPLQLRPLLKEGGSSHERCTLGGTDNLAGACCIAVQQDTYIWKTKSARAALSRLDASMPDELAAAIALFGDCRGMILLVPVDLWAPDILLRIGAAAVGLLAIVSSIYVHASRNMLLRNG